jgi:hypothetical protein
LQAAGYILLYNVMFILPLFIIFLLALWGVTSEQFSGFLKKNLAAIKIIMAALFFSLGVLLVYTQAPFAVRERETIEESREWDFGSVQEGLTLKYIFALRNNTLKTLNIKAISSSCGCTISKIRKRVLVPGELTTIEVSFNSKGYSGPVQQYVYVHTDNLDNPIIRFIIKANVEK